MAFEFGVTHHDWPLVPISFDNAHQLPPQLINGGAALFTLATGLTNPASPGFDVREVVLKYVRDLDFRANVNKLLDRGQAGENGSYLE